MWQIIIRGLFVLVLASQSVYAKEYTYSQALALYTDNNLQQPLPESDGRIQTLNEKGAMAPSIDIATERFIADNHHKKVLEIGGAYGHAMLTALRKNNDIEYHINDLDDRHLFIAANNLEQAVGKNEIPEKATQHVKYISADITSNKFPANEKYDAILVARVLHFFSPQQMKAALINFNKLLKPQGRIYIIAITPYVKRYESFIPEYERRVANKEEYPGFVPSLAAWLNKDVTSKSQQQTISKDPFMFLDDRVLSEEFSKNGFKVLECKTVDLGFKSETWSLDGREYVVLIAEKA